MKILMSKETITEVARRIGCTVIEDYESCKRGHTVNIIEFTDGRSTGVYTTRYDGKNQYSHYRRATASDRRKLRQAQEFATL